MPSTSRACRRKLRRISLAGIDDAVLEFPHPTFAGRSSVATLQDISISGLSFRVPEGGGRLESGAELKAVRVRVGDCAVDGDLLVMHLSDDEDDGVGDEIVCGALFYPASDTDLIKLKSLIAGIEAAGSESA